jgi:tight adherence protein C
MLPPVVIYFAFFAAMLLLAIVVVDWGMERAALRRTLRGAQMAGGMSSRQQELAGPTFWRVVMPGLQRFGRVSRRLSPTEAFDRTEHEIVLAGSPRGWDAERVFAFKLILPVLFAGLSLWFLLSAREVSLTISLLGAALSGFVGWYAPEWVVRSRAGNRQKEMQRRLPDSLDLMSITVEAGLAFDAALTRVATNIGGPLGEELYRVVQEMQLGKSRSDALRDLSDRTNVDDLRSFIAAMVQADALGVPIVKVLQVQAKEIRIRRRQRIEEQAQKLPVKIVFPVVLTIFPALFVVLLGPAAIQIYRDLFSAL